MSKVLLINLPIQYYLQKDFARENAYNPSLGLLAIGSWLDLNGYEVEVLDLCYIRLNKQDLLKKIGNSKPLLIGISVYTENVDMGLSTAKLIKEEYPEVKIILGGAHATLAYQDCIASPHVDFVSRKEGESSFLELVIAIESNEQRIRYDQIKGIVYRKNDSVVVNKLARPIEDLDLLPIQKRELADASRYNKTINISTSRGCPGRCIYCAATTIAGATYRVRSVENVFLEIVLIKHIFGDKVKMIYMVDDTFTAIKSRVTSFIGFIHRYDLNLEWHCESRVDVMTPELLEQMSKAGCKAIQYGIESGSQEVLNKIQKGIDLEHARKIIDATCENHILPLLSFMIGHYCDTKETMQQTIDFINEICSKYPAEVALSYNTPFPGTWQYTHREELGLKLRTNNYSALTLLNPVVETDNFTVNDLRIAYGKAYQNIARFTSLNLWMEKHTKNMKEMRNSNET